MPHTYRKKPIEIQAAKFKGTLESASKIIDWILKGGGTARYNDVHDPRYLSDDEKREGVGHRVNIDTLEGTMVTSPGDFVIQGVHGEFYPCKPDVFEASYDRAT